MTLSAAEYWDMIHAERARLSGVLDGLTTQQWQAASLCTNWTVEEVTAHLTAAAHTGTGAWLRSIALAGFNADRHNARRLAKHLGSTPTETGDLFREAINLEIAPTKDYAAWLGEVVVHGQDIARPLGITLTPDHNAVREVASYFAAKDFAVNSHTAVKDLTLAASDSEFTVGSGPMVRGPLLSLVMAMAGRHEYLAELDGEGVSVLHGRIG